ncbi:MFS transporter [Roseateles sp. BYS180W]|uniref:MFS transporter n=1 Tax=Roseateles rivi TaxID=3299028 RepID=A0ABW7FUF3_9BURK
MSALPPAATPDPAPGPSPWAWVSTLYFTQSLPYVAVMVLSVVMYKNLGLNNTDIALYTSWLYLPWVIKPLWAPLIELLGRKRHWIALTQAVVGLLLALVALSLPMERFFQLSLALLWLMAFASASHDIAADGFYLLALPRHQQTAFVGVRSAFYRLANISAQGGLVWLAGTLHERHGSWVLAWQLVLGLLAAALLGLALWHQFVLPRPSSDQPTPRTPGNSPWRSSVEVFTSFARQPGLAATVAFLLLYRFPEAQLLKLATPFLLDAPEVGGLGLSNQQVGLVYGSVGLGALTLGGLAGGWLISRQGLGRVLWPLVAAMHLPNLVFVLLAALPGLSLWWVGAALALEQFGYGLGFAAYLTYMLKVAEGDGDNPYKTAHYALCTGLMALGMMLPGMWSGWLQAQLGYLGFFGWVLVASLPSLLATAAIQVPRDWGRRSP